MKTALLTVTGFDATGKVVTVRQWSTKSRYVTQRADCLFEVVRDTMANDGAINCKTNRWHGPS